jgi:hypothetical protein
MRNFLAIVAHLFGKSCAIVSTSWTKLAIGCTSALNGWTIVV